MSRPKVRCQVQEKSTPRRSEAVEKGRDAKHAVTAGLENRKADEGRSCGRLIV